MNERGEANAWIVGGLAGVGLGVVSGALVALQGPFPPDSLLLPLVQTFGAPATLAILYFWNQRKGKNLSHLEVKRLEQLIERQTEAITDALARQTVNTERTNANSLTLLNAQIELLMEKQAARIEQSIRERRSANRGG